MQLSCVATTDVLATVLEEMPPFPERESSILAKLKKRRPDKVNNVELKGTARSPASIEAALNNSDHGAGGGAGGVQSPVPPVGRAANEGAGTGGMSAILVDVLGDLKDDHSAGESAKYENCIVNFIPYLIISKLFNLLVA